MLCTAVATGFFSCCTANYKCASDFDTASFRILSPGGNDLVFGAASVYRKDSIRFFLYREQILFFIIMGPVLTSHPEVTVFYM